MVQHVTAEVVNVEKDEETLERYTDKGAYYFIVDQVREMSPRAPKNVFQGHLHVRRSEMSGLLAQPSTKLCILELDNCFVCSESNVDARLYTKARRRCGIGLHWCGENPSPKAQP